MQQPPIGLVVVRSKKIKSPKVFENKQSNEPPAWSKTLQDHIKNYLYYSTLHGLRYVGDSAISIFERTFFAASFLMVVVLTFYYISNIYEKWSASPVIIALNAVATPVVDIPFPAVTICNMNQARESVVSSIVKGTAEDMLLQGLCNKPVNFTGTKAENTNWTKFRAFLVRVSHPCDQVLLICKFASVQRNCMDFFNTVLTDEGLCCIFNRVHPQFLIQNYNSKDDFDVSREDDGLIPDDWTPENGFGIKHGAFPRRARGPGSHMGLNVLLNIDVAEYHCSTTNSAGFKVLLHNPTETPKIADYGFSITAGQEYRVVITPRMSDASPLIRKVPIKQRQCVFSNEGNLTYFRTYSQKNCEMECESRILIEVCGCVLYYMPRVNDNTSICNRDDWECYEKIKLAIELATNDTFHCDCLPACFEMSYIADVSAAQLGTDGFFVRQKVVRTTNSDYVNHNYVSMQIYYEESMFRRYSKEEFIGFTEFLSNTGGLLGLFMGFSVVSIIEVVYFLTIRPICAVRRRQTGLTAADHTSTESAIAPIKVWNRRSRLIPILEKQRRLEDNKNPTRFRCMQKCLKN